MSAEPKPYNQLYINAWTILSVVVSTTLFLVYVFGTSILHFTYLATPII
jgi:hypothetical protein